MNEVQIVTNGHNQILLLNVNGSLWLSEGGCVDWQSISIPESMQGEITAILRPATDPSGLCNPLWVGLVGGRVVSVELPAL